MKMKKCARCRIEKPLDSFGLFGRSLDGHQSYCKTCSANYSAERRKRLAGQAPDTISTCRKCGARLAAGPVLEATP